MFSLHCGIKCKTDIVVKAAYVWNWDSPKKTVRCNYPGEQMSSEGRLSWLPLKLLICDDLVGVVTIRDRDGGHTMAETIDPSAAEFRRQPGGVFADHTVIGSTKTPYGQ